MSDNKLKISQGDQIHLSDFANITGFSQKHIRDLSKEGYLPQMNKSTFPDGAEALIKLISHLRGNGDADFADELNKEKFLLIQAKRRKENALAKKHENKVVDIDLVEEVWTSVGSEIRNTLLATIPRLNQEINKAKDDGEREKIIQSAFETVLNKLSDGDTEEILKLHEKTLEDEEDDVEEDNEETKN